MAREVNKGQNLPREHVSEISVHSWVHSPSPTHFPILPVLSDLV